MAATIRNTKIDTNTVAKIAASDMTPPPQRPVGTNTDRNRLTRSPLAADRSEALLDLDPGLDEGHAIFDAIDHHLRPNRDWRAVETLGCGGEPLSSNGI